jgi:hypothetical protein
MMLVTPKSLAEWLDRYQGGSRIVSATMLCPLPMNKTHRNDRKIRNPFLVDGESTIDHLSERLVLCGAKYENMVSGNWQKNLEPTDQDWVPAFQAEAIWSGKGVHLNSYVVQHTEKQSLYLCLFYAATNNGESWVDKALQQEAWLDRFTGLPIQPDWTALEPFLPPAPKPSIKQGCRTGVDVELDLNGDTYTIIGGENKTETRVRMPHLENVLMLRSFDLRKRGEYEVIQVQRSKYQISL